MKKRWDPDWTCPLCNTLIFGRHGACKKCKTPKIKQGDWVCRRTPCVQEFNFASRVDCRRCHQLKPIHCVCLDPQFESLNVNGNTEKSLGACQRCLCPNPRPWFETILDRQEVTLHDLPRHYRIDLNGRGSGRTITGKGVLSSGYANRWLFTTREDVVAELQALNGYIVSVFVLPGLPE